jgi:hypothetical protein
LERPYLLSQAKKQQEYVGNSCPITRKKCARSGGPGHRFIASVGSPNSFEPLPRGLYGFLTFVDHLVGWGRPPALPEYLFFASIETVRTWVIIWQAWTWSEIEAAVGSKQIVCQRTSGNTSF